MLPGFRLVLAAITATFIIVVLGFGLLVKLQVAQSGSASLAPVEARFAGLAFADRADWSPGSTSRQASLEALAPFAKGRLTNPPPSNRAVPVDRGPSVALSYSGHAMPLDGPAEQSAPNVAMTAPKAIPAATLPRAFVGRVPGTIALSAPSARPPALPPPDMAQVRVAMAAPKIAAASIGPVPPTLVFTATSTPQAAAITPAVVVSRSGDLMSDLVEAVAAREEPGPAVTFPIQRPGTAGLSRSAVPLPAPRPVAAPLPQRRKARRRAKRTTAQPPVPRSATAARASSPPVSAAPSNPFAALFGGSNDADRAPN